jgi:hypothetical protein
MLELRGELSSEEDFANRFGRHLRHRHLGSRCGRRRWFHSLRGVGLLFGILNVRRVVLFVGTWLIPVFLKFL